MGHLRRFLSVRFRATYRFKMLFLIIVLPSVLFSSTAQSSVSLPPTSPTDSLQALNIWAIQVEPGVNARQLAAQMGFEYLYPVGALERWHVVRSSGVSGLRDDITATLTASPQIATAYQQFALPVELHRMNFNDTNFKNSWHLENTGQNAHGEGRGIRGNDINVQPVWDPNNDGSDADGYTGEGVAVAVIDDGVQWRHPDLKPNFRKDISYDFIDADDDPSGEIFDPGNPVPFLDDIHGTATSGLVAATANNGKCSVGVAYNADLVGLRFLPSLVNRENYVFDAAAAAAITHRMDEVQIYSNSWGFGNAVNFTRFPLFRQAIDLSAMSGRDGKGSILIYSAGNGNERNESTNSDYLTSSRYTIVVGGTNDTGRAVFYSTRGPGVMVNAPTWGVNTGEERTTSRKSGVYTTDFRGVYGYSTGSNDIVGSDCTSTFSGTSASAPIISGVAALILQANPDLTLRDMQHILAETSDPTFRKASFIDAPSHDQWQINASGHVYSHAYGFGRINAAKAVAAAQTWTPVPPEVEVSGGLVVVNQPIPDVSPVGITSTYTVNPGDLPDNFVVEHIVLNVNIPHNNSGQLRATLTGPSGVQSLMRGEHPRVTARGEGASMIADFPMLTRAHWGETTADLTGDWTFHVADLRLGTNTPEYDQGTFEDWRMTFYGYISPDPVTAGPKANAGVNLLQNGDFETDGDSNKLPDGWTVKPGSHSKIKCSTAPFKIIEGCSLLIKGHKSGVTQLTQKLDSSAVTAIQPGDSLMLIGTFDTVKANKGKYLTATIQYNDTALKKDVLWIGNAARNSSVGSVQRFVPIIAKGTVNKITVQLNYARKAGKYYVDNVGLMHNAAGFPGAAANGLVTLPDAPSLTPADGLRGMQ